MTNLKIRNPFNAPVFFEDTVASTMDVSRRISADGAEHGTVIASGFQSEGRGRVRGRSWEMEKGMSLPFTILLRYPSVEDIPPALTLRAGLAVSFAIENFAPSLRGSVMIKWPNDLIIGAKKVAGILCEADGGNVHIGIGINFAQKKFPAHLREKATSIALANGNDFAPEDRFVLLEKIMEQIYAELETGGNLANNEINWKNRIDQRLYKKGEQIVFTEGAADSGKTVNGTLAGIGEGGELLILQDGVNERSFITGELLFND